jgi:hypothetical protein
VPIGYNKRVTKMEIFTMPTQEFTVKKMNLEVIGFETELRQWTTPFRVSEEETIIMDHSEVKVWHVDHKYAVAYFRSLEMFEKATIKEIISDVIRTAGGI